MSHEAKCRRCGECCRVKVEVNGKVVGLGLFCPALDMETRTCRIYDWRHSELAERLIGFRCAEVSRMIAARLCPTDCAYAYDDYVGCDYDGEGDRIADPYGILQEKISIAKRRQAIDEYLERQDQLEQGALAGIPA